MLPCAQRKNVKEVSRSARRRRTSFTNPVHPAVDQGQRPGSLLLRYPGGYHGINGGHRKALRQAEQGAHHVERRQRGARGHRRGDGEYGPRCDGGTQASAAADAVRQASRGYLRHHVADKEARLHDAARRGVPAHRGAHRHDGDAEVNAVAGLRLASVQTARTGGRRPLTSCR